MTIDDIAAWMMSEIEKHQILYQQEAATEIADRFGAEFTPENENGNPSIRKDVLKAFRELSGDSVVWVRSEFCWRSREPGDDPGRLQE
jgi:hypothetical protein